MNPHRYQNHWWVEAESKLFKSTKDLEKMSQKDLDKLQELINQYKQVYSEQLRQEQKYDQKYEMLPYMDKPLKNSQKTVINQYLNNQIDKNKMIQDPNKKVSNRYMRQPRLQIDYNYNYEQHRSYTNVYRKQKKKDKQKWIDEKRMYKYLYLNKDNSVDAQRIIKKDNIDFDALPMEQIMKQDISDFKVETKGSKRAKLRKYIKTKYSKDITNYTAWRNFDRSLLNLPINFKRVNPCCKIVFPPKLIKQVFGSPNYSDGFDKSVSTGLSFQDQNFDIFLLYEYRQTTCFHGQNRQDEYYDYLRRLKGPGTRMRKQKWPSVEEFWQSNEPKEFRVTSSQYADFRKFKMWFKTQIKNYQEKKAALQQEGKALPNKDQLILQKFKSGYGAVSRSSQIQQIGRFEDYNKKQIQMIERQVSPIVFRMSCKDWMDKQELKTYKEEDILEKYECQQYFDFSKAQQVRVSKQELESEEDKYMKQLSAQLR